jgi:type III secretion system (T3SS) SseB-like protein
MGAKESVADSDVVYVPAHPITAGNRKDVGFETRQLASGEQAALAFTSLPRLVESLGESQPWLAMPMGHLRSLMATNGVGKVALDPTVPAEAWRWGPEDLSEAIGDEPR